MGWGHYKAKVSLKVFNRLKDEKRGKLILITTINSTPAGEGKTTTTIGLAQALQKLGYHSMIGIRDHTLSPVFGIRGNLQVEVIPGYFQWRILTCF